MNRFPIYALHLAVAGAVIGPTTAAHAAPYQGVVLDKSSITFSYRQMGVAMDGRFRKFAPQVSFDPARPEQAKARIEVELASIDTGSGEADQEVAGKPWFHTQAFPKATFVATQVKAAGPGQFEVVGQLTLKGQPRDLRFTLKHAGQGSTGVLSGGFSLQRADFGIGEGVWSKFDVVANEVKVQFSLAVRTGP